MKLWKEGRMKIYIKDKEEIQAMREGGKILGIVLAELEKMIAPGITTIELDTKAEALIREHGGVPSFKGYRGFRHTLCTSINEQVVHGIPGPVKLKEGDILTVDCGVLYKGFHTDSAITKGVGEIDDLKRKFINTCGKALQKAIEAARPGIRVKQLSKIIQETIEKEGYSAIRDMVGHGVGQYLHEDPCVYNFVNNEPSPILQPGMTLAIEPIISMGDYHIKTLRDGWTTVTVDGSLAAQIEHTIVITEKGAEILTKRPN
jgi:methionyl aminopeptidase